MIFINRNKIEKPAYFSSQEHEIAEAELLKFYNLPKKERSQKHFTSYRMPQVIREALHVLFNDKCAYCESKVELFKEVSGKINLLQKASTQKISSETISIANHFRPRNNARGFEKEDASVDHYWWLMYEWNNLYLSCSKCRTNKSNWFPIEGQRTKLLSDYKTILKQEKSLLLDPCNDHIENLNFEYDFKTGVINGVTKKGKVTIEILGLNRKNLVSARYKAIQEEASYFKDQPKKRSLRIFKREINSLFKKDKKEIKFKREVKFKSEVIHRWEEIINGSSALDFLGIRRAYLRWNAILDLTLKADLNSIDSKREIPISLPPQGTERDLIEISNLEQKDADITVNDDIVDLVIDIPEVEDLVVKKPDIKQTKDTIDEEIFNIRSLLKNVHIEKIELKNYKCFDYLEIKIPEVEVKFDKEEEPQEPWLVFLGENGVGKSSLIKAVAIALMGQDYLNTLKLDPKKVLKHGSQSGYIKVYGTKRDEIYEVTFNSEKLTSNITESVCYLLGYGSTRLLPKGNLEPEADSNYVKTKNLFDYSVSLSDAKQWLLDIPEDQFDNVASSIKELLLLNNEDIIQIDNNKTLYINYAEGNNRTDIEELSDGYRSIFALTVDIMKTLSLGNLTFKEAEAVVLLDEIGTHLHPRWKMEVVNRLRKTFPRIQFIVTTHEPLCLKGLKKNEVIVLKKNEEREIISITDLPNPSDFRVDQLLTSEYFGLNSTLDFQTEEKFKRYYSLLAKEDRSPEEEENIIKLSQELPNKIGNDIRDELVYHVIDELLAKQIKEQGFKLANDDIKEEAVKRVKEIWDFIDNND